FFQAEDGIRDFHVTGVQTCALPIFVVPPPLCEESPPPVLRVLNVPGSSFLCVGAPESKPAAMTVTRTSSPSESSMIVPKMMFARSEERRVGKECRDRWWREQDEV